MLHNGCFYTVFIFLILDALFLLQLYVYYACNTVKATFTVTPSIVHTTNA